MAQLDKIFTAFWMNTATAPWTPLTGLSATITIRDTNGNVAVNAQPMTEVGGGWYKYEFTAMDVTKDYLVTYNPWATAYIESGVTDKRMANLDSAITDIRTGRWFSVDLSPITRWLGNISKQISSIKLEEREVDLNPILEKIDEIKIPEFPELPTFEEKEAKKLLKLVNTLDKKISEYIDSVNQSKEELSEIADEFTKLEMEERMKEIEYEKEKKMEEEERKKMEEEEDKKLLEEIAKEFDKLEEEDKIEKKKELEQELKEKEKEIKEIQKELNSLE